MEKEITFWAILKYNITHLFNKETLPMYIAFTFFTIIGIIIGHYL